MSSNSTDNNTNNILEHEDTVTNLLISSPPPFFSFESLTQDQRDMLNKTFHVITNDEGYILTRDIFEQTIKFKQPNKLTYTPNTLNLEYGENYIGQLENGEWDVIYWRNSTSYYLYRTLKGDYWMIGFINGKLNSSSHYTPAYSLAK